MQEILQLLLYSSKAVGSVMLIAGAGAMLVRFNIINREAMRTLGQLVYFLMLPCLLFTTLASTVNLQQLAEFWIFPVSCVIHVFTGILAGALTAKFCRPPEEMKAGVAAATAFSNTGYLPIPLLIAVTQVFPCFRDDPKAAGMVVAYISVFLMGYSPLLWTFGHAMIAGRKIGDISLRQFFPPPVIGMLLGVVFGLTPFLRQASCSSSGLLNPFFNAASVIAQGTVPCALLLLGGNLANGPVKGTVNRRSIFSVIFIRLITFPILAIIFVYVLRHFGLIPSSLLLALVLVVEAGSPPATNLVIMASLSNHKLESGLSTLLFWNYLASIISLTAVIMSVMWIFG
ncbi:MAG: AEC family transporter [Victivallaceae bacterium]